LKENFVSHAWRIFKRLKRQSQLVVRACNPSTQEAETGVLQVQGQPGLHRETLVSKKQQKKNWLMNLG
jgi:hypothetical protein